MDVVVTVPKTFTYAGKRGLAAWVAEGDLPGEEWSGEESHFYLGSWGNPQCMPGERVYVICEGRLRGYAPLVRIEKTRSGIALVRRGGAVAVTLPLRVRQIGFRGWRYRWWNREVEIPFPDWQETERELRQKSLFSAMHGGAE